MYNITPLQNAENITGIVTYANTVTDGAMSILMILAVFFILLLILKRWSFEDALLTSSFICFILSSFLTYGKFLNFMFPLAFLIMTALTALYVYVTRR